MAMESMSLERQKAFSKWRVHSKDLVLLSQGRHMREFLHPSGFVDGYARILERMVTFEHPCETFVLGCKPNTTRDLAKKIIGKVGKGRLQVSEDSMGRGFDQNQ